jgi:hypothetical protein
MGRSTLLFALLMMVVIADLAGNHGVVVGHIFGYLAAAGHWTHGVFDSLANFFTSGR